MMDRYVVMTERDVKDWRESFGPIVHETTGAEMSFTSAIKRAESLRQYGRTQIFKLVPVCHACGEIHCEELHI